MDTREKSPYKFRASKNCAGCETEKLDYGDYQVKGLPSLIVIERKNSITELCGNIGKNRDRFERELKRMEEARFRYVIVEDHWSSIWRAKYTKLHPNSILQSIVAFELKYGVHFIFAGNRKQAHQITRSLLIKAHKYWQEGRWNEEADGISS